MMRILVTGNNKGFSLVEVLVTLAIIGACYVAIAKGLIENMQTNRRVEENASILLTARHYFTDYKDLDQTNVHISVENSGNGLSVHTIEFFDNQERKIIDFKEVTLESQK